VRGLGAPRLLRLSRLLRPRYAFATDGAVRACSDPANARCRVGRSPEVPMRAPRRGKQIARNRPIHKPGAGCTACSRCWRSRRTAISSSYPIEQTPTSPCICSSTPSTDAGTIPPALPSPARTVVFARANAALSDLVQPGRDSSARSGTCSVMRATAPDRLLTGASPEDVLFVVELRVAAGPGG
jgi:hypothetical protein